jgi:hypothetical protein
MDKRQMKNYVVPPWNIAHTSPTGKRIHLFTKKKLKNDLTCVAKNINLNTYEKIIRIRKSQTCEYCINPDKKILFQFSSRIRTDETVWSIGTSGVSLRKGCREIPNDVTNPGRKSCFYSQTPSEPCSANKRIFPLKGKLRKRCSIPIYKNVSKAIRCEGEFGKSQQMVYILIGIDQGHQGSSKFESSILTLMKSDFFIFYSKISQNRLTFDSNSIIIMSNEDKLHSNTLYFDLYDAQFQCIQPFSIFSLQTPRPMSIIRYIHFHSILSIFIFKVLFIQSIPNTNTKKMSQIKNQGKIRKLQIEYHYDRLLSKKIQQVYRTLVPLEILFRGGRKCLKLESETEIEIETEREHNQQQLKLRIEKGGDLYEDSCYL